MEEITHAPDDMANAETYAVALRIAAKLMAFKALNRIRENKTAGTNWLLHGNAANCLAEEYEKAVVQS